MVAVRLGRFAAPKLAVLGASAAAIFPILFALSDEARFGSFRPIARGDEAILELHVGQALRFTHLLGPYSQYGWYHPGPLYYYLLGPLYVLTHHASRSLNVSVALMNLAAVVGMLLIARKLEKGTAGKLLGTLLVGLFVAALATRVPEGAVITNPLIEIWNPFATVLPFGLLVFAAVAVARGQLALLPLAAFLHAFTIQTHISYFLPATLLIAGALAWARWVDRSVPSERLLRAVGVSAAVSFVLWLPPLIALAIGQPGNARAILRFAASEHRPHVGAVPGLFYALRQLQAPVLRWLEVPVGSGTALAALLTAVSLAGAVVCLRPNARHARPYPAAFAAAALLLTSVSLAQSLSLVSLRENTFYYQTLWFSLVGCLGWVGPVHALHAWLARWRGLRPVAWFGVPAAACVLSALAVRAVARDYERCRESALPHPEPSELAVPLLEPVFDARASEQRYVLGGTGLGAGLTSVILGLWKLGTPATIASQWDRIMGNGARYGSDDRPVLSVSSHSGKLLHEHPLWRGLGSGTIYAEDIDRRVALSKGDPGCTVVGTQGTVDDPGRVCDGKVPSHDNPRNLETAELGPTGAVVVHLAAAPAGAFLDGIRVRANGRTPFLIDGSRDGLNFDEIGELRRRRVNNGVRWRSFYFNDGGAWPVVRVRSVDEDGRGSSAIEEIEPLFSEGALLDLHESGVDHGALVVALVPGHGYDLTLTLRPARTPRGDRRLRVTCHGAVVGEFELAPGVDATCTVVLPPERVLASTRLGFELVSGPEGAGTDLGRAIEFRSALFRPSVLGSRG